MTPGKRILDIFMALTLGVLLIIPLLAVMLILLLIEGRPTMRPSPENTGVTGGDKGDRIPPIYRRLRKSRFDEIPQLWNVLKGDMSFVGPRPPLRLYVAAFPEIYSEVLRNRPGLTGLASLRFHKHEERLLAATRNATETDDVYRTRCVPRKATLLPDFPS